MMMKASESSPVPETSSSNQEIIGETPDKCGRQCTEEEELPSSEAAVVIGNFDCNICLELSQDPVVTACGHLFCWPCLYCWLTIHSISKECPVCKASVQDKITPLYGRGKIGYPKTVPEMNIPRRPSACRFSVTPAGRCPAASFPNHGIGFHESLTEYGGSFSSRTAYNASFAFPATTSIMTHQRRLNNQQEFVLYWFFILLASFTIGCFLVF